jgi:hypothetical protein
MPRLARHSPGDTTGTPPATWTGSGSPAPAAVQPAAPHRRQGQRLPRGTARLTDGSSVRLYELFHDGHFVLLTRDAASSADMPLPDGVRHVRYQQTSAALPPAVLVRPDGYIAWASADGDPQARAAAATEAAILWAGSRSR